MKALFFIFFALLFTNTGNAQVSQSTLDLFAKKTVPYEGPTDFYSDLYLEDDEPSTIPFKELTKEQLSSISGSDFFSGIAYAVEQISLNGKNIGLIVYQVTPSEYMPYEEVNYQLYIIDAAGKPSDNINISSDSFRTDNSGEINISEEKTSLIRYGEYDSDRLFLEVTYDNTESVQADYGQQRSVISKVYFEIEASGKLVDVTVYLEE
jgi:hypothetical protein